MWRGSRRGVGGGEGGATGERGGPWLLSFGPCFFYRDLCGRPPWSRASPAPPPPKLRKARRRLTGPFGVRVDFSSAHDGPPPSRTAPGHLCSVPTGDGHPRPPSEWTSPPAEVRVRLVLVVTCVCLGAPTPVLVTTPAPEGGGRAEWVVDSTSTGSVSGRGPSSGSRQRSRSVTRPGPFTHFPL